MSTTKARNIITGSIVITLIIATVNSIYKNDKLPGFRLYFGSGILFLMLSGLAEFEAEIAQNIAIAILVFTVIGEGGGAINHVLGAGAAQGPLNTQPKSNSHHPQPPGEFTANIPRHEAVGINATVGTAFLLPNKYSIA